MLPNLRIVICAVMLTVLLFAVTGTGVVMPESYTRIGEMPEIGRPMMQRMITDEPAQAQFLALTLARRTEEIGRLQERTALEVETALAEADPEPGTVKQAAIENPEPGAVVAAVATAPALQPSGAMGTVPGILPASTPEAAEAQPVTATAKPDGAADATPPAANPEPEPEPVRVAALPPTAADAQPAEPSPSPHVKVPHLRPTAKASAAAHRRTFHRAHRFGHAQATGFHQDTFGQPSFQMR
jgi:hypothetical protein